MIREKYGMNLSDLNQEDFETHLREWMLDKDTQKVFSHLRYYSVDFLREWKDKIDFKKLFTSWYNDQVINPNVYFREYNTISFKEFLQMQFPQYEEFWKDLV